MKEVKFVPYLQLDFQKGKHYNLSDHGESSFF